jgi:hypothetical protein
VFHHHSYTSVFRKKSSGLVISNFQKLKVEGKFFWLFFIRVKIEWKLWTVNGFNVVKNKSFVPKSKCPKIFVFFIFIWIRN